MDGSIPILRSFAKNYGINAKNWHLLTGKKVRFIDWHADPILQKNIGFTKDSTEFLHTEHILLVDSDLRLRGYTMPL